MSNPNSESAIKELLELRRMKEEPDAEIQHIEDPIKQAMGHEETLIAGAFKIDWKPVISSRIDTAALKKALPEITERFMKQTAKEDIPAMIHKHYPAYAAKKMNVSELASVCKLSRPTVYKSLKLIA